MSKIEVNTVDTQCGTNLTVGAACKSVTVAGNDVRSNAYKAADGGNIASQSGTTITLGASGDTVTLASGASQSGFGRTGTVDWQTGSIKTGDFTATNGEGYFINTTSGSVTMTLPAGSAGAIVSAQDYNNTFDSNAFTILPNGSEKINGGAGPVSLTTEGEGVTLVYVDGTVGWRAIQDSAFADVGSNFVSATGGTETTSGNCKIHTFTGPGTFTVSAAGSPTNAVVSYLVVAGGGGGGRRNNSDGGGGGGAGGFREYKSPVTPYTASPLDGNPCGTAVTVTAQAYPITVGGGGTGGTTTNGQDGTNGSNSIFSTISSAGGGVGGEGPGVGGAGGSGGGNAGGTPQTTASGNTPPTTPPQGNPGGQRSPSPDAASGGGGGAGAAGATASGSSGGNGGAGVTTSITASPLSYAGGGGAGSAPGRPTSQGTGGSGTGGDGDGGSGTTNRGGGGGGSNGTSTNGGAGGSGVVVIRYKYQ